MIQKLIQSFTIFSLLFSLNSQASVESVFAPIPVQDAGRIKPFDTYARETLQLVYGKKSFAGRPAVEILFTWIILPHEWDNIEFVQIDHKEVKDQLKLDINRKRFTPIELFNNERLDLLFQELQAKKENQDKLNPFFQAVERLQNQLTVYKAVGQGYVPGWIPNAETGTWLPLKDFNEEYKNDFLKITKSFAQTLGDPSQESQLQQAVQIFVEKTRSEDLKNYPSKQKLNLEVQYNQLHPFQWAWIFYLISFVLMLIYFISQKNFIYKMSLLMILVAFGFHTYGFVIRSILAGRPPVSNMYETVIWVPWGATFFSLIFLKFFKNKFFIFSSAIISFFCLVLADLAPVLLDSSIRPLEPVLRSNLWLTVHVMTITIGYGALFLSFVLGDIALCFYLFGGKKHASQLASLRASIYRAIQVGVLLLGAGTILGGVWADYSWGRFWGWDPKETWALIAFLGYIAILHGRLAGWIKPFGFVAWSVLSFNLVVMAWYGVNYVLGAGLHSYGFGGGGVSFVATICGLHAVFVGTVWFLRAQKIIPE